MKKLNPYEYLEFEVDEDNIKSRRYLEKQNISSRLVKKACRESNVYINGKRVYKNMDLKKGDSIAIKFPEESYNGLGQTKDIKIIYEDNDLIIVDKEANMVTHTDKDDLKDTLLNYMIGYFQENNIKRKVRFVNRLDRDTSGLIIIAKNSFAHAKLAEEFENNEVVKTYVALCRGDFKEKEGEIIKPIARSDDGIKREINIETGKYARTKYEVIKDLKKISLVYLRLYTGRTHQIRVHMASIGHPIIADTLYNYKEEDNKLLSRQALHSYSLKFKLPRTGEQIVVKSRIPSDFIDLLREYSWILKRIIV